MKKYFALLILLTGLGLILSQMGLRGLPFEGKWNTSGGDENFASYQTYSFRDGHYSMEGYPSISKSGSYSIVLQEENTYTLLMDPRKAALESGDPFLIRLSLYENGEMMMSGYSANGGVIFSR